MVTTSVGWALSTVEPAPPSGSRPQIVRTSDGGAHWAAVQPHFVEPVAAVGADFHDPAEAWVLELLDAESTASFQTVFIASTTDGGINWKRSPRLSVNGQATHIQFVDSLHGWVFAIPSAGGALGSQDTSLYRTIDGGDHWHVIRPASQARSSTGDYGTLPEDCGGPIGPPSFIDAKTGWIGAFCDRVFLDVTRDGGLTWKTQPLPAFPGPAYPESGPLLYSVDSPQFTTPQDGTLVVHRGVTGPTFLQEAAIYSTDDGGASWAEAGYRIPLPVLAADFVDAQHGWVITAMSGGRIDHRSLYGTVDGGHSWRLVSGPQDYFARELNFVSDTTGFIAEPVVKDQPGQLLRTNDGGATWVPIQFSVS